MPRRPATIANRTETIVRTTDSTTLVTENPGAGDDGGKDRDRFALEEGGEVAAAVSLDGVDS